MLNEAEIPKRIRCISEHNWDIPLAHKLMVARNDWSFRP
ncbi:hypothetical protein SVIOM74S_04470 [Streptomyces violarus]